MFKQKRYKLMIQILNISEYHMIIVVALYQPSFVDKNYNHNISYVYVN